MPMIPYSSAVSLCSSSAPKPCVAKVHSADVASMLVLMYTCPLSYNSNMNAHVTARDASVSGKKCMSTSPNFWQGSLMSHCAGNQHFNSERCHLSTLSCYPPALMHENLCLPQWRQEAFTSTGIFDRRCAGVQEMKKKMRHMSVWKICSTVYLRTLSASVSVSSPIVSHVWQPLYCRGDQHFNRHMQVWMPCSCTHVCSKAQKLQSMQVFAVMQIQNFWLGNLPV